MFLTILARVLISSFWFLVNRIRVFIQSLLQPSGAWVELIVLARNRNRWRVQKSLRKTFGVKFKRIWLKFCQLFLLKITNKWQKKLLERLGSYEATIYWEQQIKKERNFSWRVLVSRSTRCLIRFDPRYLPSWLVCLLSKNNFLLRYDR